MGSLISNLFANIVMEDLENECLLILKYMHNFIPKEYYRYVDDTFLVINKSEIDLVVNTFNNYDINLQFTHEIKENSSIGFLNVHKKY